MAEERCSILRDANKSRSSAGIIISLFFSILEPKRVIPKDFFLMAPSRSLPGSLLVPPGHDKGGGRGRGRVQLSCVIYATVLLL